MKHLPQHDCHLDAQSQAVATAIVNLANGDRAELQRMAVGIWPRCEFYLGGTHIRCLIEGTANGKSFYVEK